MIDRIEIEHVRALGKVDLQPGSFCVLVGANGCGKTTVLRSIELVIHDQSDWGPLGVVTLWGPGWAKRSARGAVSSSGKPGGRVRHLCVDRNRLHAPSQMPEGAELVSRTGDHLAGAVARMIIEWPDLRDAVVQDLAAIVPGFRGVRARPVRGGFELRFDFERGQDVPQEFVSTGTLYALLLLVVSRAETQTPVTVLVDDLDLALHPGAQEELVRRLVALATAANGQLQIIATTHSPFVVDAAGPEKVWVLGPGPDGSVARRLDSHPDAKRALEVLTAGEFWSSVGEAWVGKTA